MAELDEFGLIRFLTEGGLASLPRTEASKSSVVLGIGDDAAVVRNRPGFQTVLSCDTMIDQVHFRRETMTYGDIGYKALASNISDMAAMGASPLHALIALSAPPSLPVEKLKELYEGIYTCANRYGVTVIGGDTTSSPGPLVVTITITGEVEENRALLRSAARAGDAVFVTGYPGRSAAGLHYLLDRGGSAYELKQQLGQRSHIVGLIKEHQRPEPQPSAGRILLESGLCHALNDVSDGLGNEAWEIAEASGCVITLDEQALPIHEDLTAFAAETNKSALNWLLYGGEDYVLLGTAPCDAMPRLRQMFASYEGGAIPFFVIGHASEGPPGVKLSCKDRRMLRIEKKGYNHF